MQGKNSCLVRTLIVAALVLSGCQKQEPPPPPSVRVENPQLGIAIAALSPDFVVTANDATIELAPTGEAATGSVSVAAGEAQSAGINLVAAIKDHEAEIRARPDGDYKGQSEYVSPLGTTFASRGRYTGEGGAIEEWTIYMVHPKGDRTLEVSYRYPVAEDTQERINALMLGVVGELEALSVDDGTASADATAAGE